MTKYASLFAVMMCVVALGGCAVSGGGDLDKAGLKKAGSKDMQIASAIPLEASELPPLADPVAGTPEGDMLATNAADTKAVDTKTGGADVAKAEKFQQNSDEILALASPDQAFESKSSEIQQAYANALGEQAQITTERTSLKPFVGRWTLVPGAHKAKAKMQQIGAFLGLTEQCELVLEEDASGSGHKAYGNSSCPTSLFMLDSWVALGDQLVLRDHMGDDIVKLRSRGTDKWIGVDPRGETLVLSKS